MCVLNNTFAFMLLCGSTITDWFEMCRMLNRTKWALQWHVHNNNDTSNDNNYNDKLDPVKRGYAKAGVVKPSVLVYATCKLGNCNGTKILHYTLVYDRRLPEQKLLHEIYNVPYCIMPKWTLVGEHYSKDHPDIFKQLSLSAYIKIIN